jgi:ribonuclease P protein component
MQWGSPPTGRATSAASARTVSARVWRRSGAVKFSAGAARRAASVCRSGFLPSTQQRNGDHRYPRAARLTRKADIDRVRKAGRRVRSGPLDVRTLASPLTHARVGIVVPRFQRTIVERNRLRRRLRELVRLQLLPELAPQDVLVRANPSAYDLAFDALRTEILAVARKLSGAA